MISLYIDTKLKVYELSLFFILSSFHIEVSKNDVLSGVY
jgi:hypothetical protein